MRRAISVRDAVDLGLAPFSVLSGIVTIWFAPLADFVKWLVGGMLIVFVPMALIILYLMRRTKPKKRGRPKEHGMAVVIW